MRLTTLILYFFLCAISITQAQHLYFPPSAGNHWATISPGTQAYCKPQIDSLYTYLEQNNTKAFILLKDGKIVLEKYFGSFTADSSWYWRGADKTLTAVLFGIAQSQNKINIEESSQMYLGEGWTSLPKEKEAAIKVVDHLRMTTGLDNHISDLNCIEPNCLKFKSIANSEWTYYNAPFYKLNDVLKSATGSSLNQHLFSTLRGTIGMNGSYTRWGNNYSFRSNARSAARFGLFLLAQGNWNKKPILSDSNYFNQMTSSSQAFNVSYGYGTWINGQASYQLPQDDNVFNGELNPYAPNDMFVALGNEGQLINIVPSEGLVWVRFGNQPELGNGASPAIFNNNVWKRIKNLNCESFTIVAESNSDDAKLTPKPGKDEIRISTKVTIQKIMIADQSGKVIFAEDINSKKLSINTKQFPKGTYYARIFFSEEIVSTQKFVVN